MIRSFLGPRALAWCLFAFLLSFPVSATERTDLSGEWRFRIDAKSEGEKLQWNKSIPEGTELVRVPHTWNIGKYEDHEGLAWYFRTVDVPALRPQERVRPCYT